MILRFIVLWSILSSYTLCTAQSLEPLQDSLKRNRAIYGTALYSAYGIGSVALYSAWYKNTPRSSFHLYNDSQEWLGMDKAGHLYSAYAQTAALNTYFKWAGNDDLAARNKAFWTATLFQTTIEMMDGFSEDWGFSIADIAANTAGGLTWYIQDKCLGKQTVKFKYSYWPIMYSDEPIPSQSGSDMTTPSIRANNLYGGSIERILKDYNAQTIWLSINLSDILGSSIPPWLNLAIGYSGQNMYGGYKNTWKDGDVTYLLNDQKWHRQAQWIFAPDIDFKRLKYQSAFWKTVGELINFVKLPTPGVSVTSRGDWQIHFIYLN